MIVRCALVTSAAALLAGCATSLSTTPVRDRTATTSALTGVSYSLPMLKYDIALKRALEGCPSSMPVPVGSGRTLQLTSGAVDVSVSAEVKEAYVRGEAYAIDYPALSAPFATSAFAFQTHPNGTLKAINATASDQTADILKEAVKFGVAVASMSTGAPALDLAALGVSGGPEKLAPPPAFADLPAYAESVTMVACKPDAALQLAAFKANAEEQKTKATTLKVATADVARHTTVAGQRRATSAHVDKLDSAIQAMDDAQRDLDKAKEAGADLLAGLSASDRTQWPEAFDAPLAGRMPFSDSGRKKLEDLLETKTVTVLRPSRFAAWLKAHPDQAEAMKAHPVFKTYFTPAGAIVDDPRTRPECTGADATPAKCLAAFSGVSAELVRVHATPACVPGAQRGFECAREGVQVQEERFSRRRSQQGRPDAPAAIVRTAGPMGRLARDDRADPGIFIRSQAEARLKLCRSASGDCPASAKAVHSGQPVSAPQLGQLRFLPFRNEMLEAAELSLVLRDDGTLDSFSYKKTRAAGAAGAAAASDAAGQIKAYEDTRRTKAADGLKAQRAEALAKLQFEIDVLNKKADLIKVQTPDTPGELDALKAELARTTTETALAEARLARLKAEAALAEEQGE